MADAWRPRPSSPAGGAGRPSARSQVFELVRAGGTISRPELAEATGLTQAAISLIVRQLIDGGMVRTAGTGQRTGGKRRTLLEINPAARVAIGIGLDFFALTVAVVDLLGNPLHIAQTASAVEADPDEVIDRIPRMVRRGVEFTGVPRANVVGVGIAAPGPVDLDHGYAVQLPGGQPWREIALRDVVESRLGMPAILENGANAAAIGEHWAGRTGSARAIATIYFDVGIGAGIVMDGEIVRGASSNAGEIGHLSIDLAGEPCHCGSRGCLERRAAPYRVAQEYERRTGRMLTAPEIGSAALAGDAECSNLLTAAGDAVAAAVLSLSNVLDLDLVILSGPGFGPALPLLLEPVSRRLDDAFFARRAHAVRVAISEHPFHAAAIGAASLALRSGLSAE